MPVFMDGSGCSDPIPCSWCFQYFPIHYCIGSCRKLLDLRVQAAFTGRAILCIDLPRFSRSCLTRRISHEWCTLLPHPMPQELPEISKQCLVLEPVNIHAASGWRRFLLGFTLAESRKLFWCKNAGGFGRFLCMNNLQNVDLHLSESIRSISRLEATTWMWSSAKHTKLGTVKGQSRSDFLVLLPYCWAKLFKGS